MARLLVPGINNEILTFCDEFIKAPYELVDYVAIFFQRRDYDAQRESSADGEMRSVLTVGWSAVLDNRVVALIFLAAR